MSSGATTATARTAPGTIPSSPITGPASCAIRPIAEPTQSSTSQRRRIAAPLCFQASAGHEDIALHAFVDRAIFLVGAGHAGSLRHVGVVAGLLAADVGIVDRQAEIARRVIAQAG